MVISSFYEYLSKIIPLDEPALKLILSKYTAQQHYQREKVIYARGKIPQQLSYLETGSAIALSASKPNRQILRFWETGQLICPVGFFNNTGASQSIIALDDCIITTLKYDKMLTFLANYPKGYELINALIAAEISSIQLLIKSQTQNQPIQQHEDFLNALSISFSE